MKTLVSFVCRVTMTQELLDWANQQRPGVTEIPFKLLAPRQIAVKEGSTFAATMKWHRDGYIPVVARHLANAMVADGDGVYCKQSLLIMDREAYLADKDVQNNQEELARVTDDAEVKQIIVAVIGESRSPLAVCRNVVSGCQNPETLREDAQGAIQAASTFLVE